MKQSKTDKYQYIITSEPNNQICTYIELFRSEFFNKISNRLY